MPEAGGWDGVSVADWDANPPKIYELRYEFDYWSGDALLESPDSLIATTDLKEAIQFAGLSGVSFDRVKVWKSEQFEEFEPGEKLPTFAWVKVEGKAGEDDFGISRNRRLVVSERALKLIEGFGISHAKVSAYTET